MLRYRYSRNHRNSLVVPFLLGGLLALSSVAANAQIMYRPTGASSNIGTGGSTNLNNVINGSGLSTGFTSGTTNLTGYSATHNNNFPANLWGGTARTGLVTFDMGSTFSTPLASFVFWNLGPTNDVRVATFTLSASNDSTFSSGVTSLGSFTTNTTGTNPATNYEVFSFTPTTARYYRMNITGTFNTNSNNTGIGEVAFAGVLAAAAPEPATFAFLALGALTGGMIVKRRKA